MGTELDDLIERITKQLDPLELLDILGFDMYDLVVLLKEEIEENRQELERALN